MDLNEAKALVLEKYETRLNNHKNRIKQAQEKGLNPIIPKELQKLTSTDLLMLRNRLHPIDSRKALQNTRDMLLLYHERKVLTVPEIYEVLGLSDKTVTKRQQAFRDFGLIYRDGKFYVATPRLKELVEKHLAKVCDPQTKRRRAGR